MLVIPLLLWGIKTQLIDNAEDKNTQTMTVSGISMSPTLKPGDKVKVGRSDNTSLLRNGDLVAVQFRTRERRMLKRVIAVEGDEVEFVDGRLKLNGEWLDTSWWPGEKRLAVRHYRILSIQLSRYDNRVPKGNLIVMGDNSNKSFDSGDYGMVSLQQVAGRVQSTAANSNNN